MNGKKLLRGCRARKERTPEPKYLTCLYRVYFRKLPDFLLKILLPHVIRRSCHCLSSIVCIFQNFRNTKVPDFDVSRVFYENVGRFYISVKDFFFVNVVERFAQLLQNTQNHQLRK